MAFLRSRRTLPLAYLSLGEDQPNPSPWHRDARNLDWNTVYVDPAHPEWVLSRLHEVQKAMEMGFEGLFLDTLDTVTLFPQDRVITLSLIAQIREKLGGRLLFANPVICYLVLTHPCNLEEGAGLE